MTVQEKTVIYIPDAKVQALRSAGIVNFSEFVREKVDEYIAGRKANLLQNVSDSATVTTRRSGDYEFCSE